MERKQILDHGYLELVETWGSDERIVEAARMSTGKGFLGWGPTHSPGCRYQGEKYSPCDCPGVPGDEKLLRYLWEHKHATPFEMAGMVIEVQAPIFVFREWRTHRTAAQVADEYQWDDCFPGDSSYNEMSARYTPLPDVNYVPTVERLMLNSKTNKQAGTVKGAEELTEAAARAFQDALAIQYAEQEKLYQWALRSGVPKELARIHLPVGRYSRMRASANLRNWLAFLTLRMAPEAQWEIRQYANAVGELGAANFPRTWELFSGGKS